MKRRNFLKTGSAASVPFFLGGIPIQTMGYSPFSSKMTAGNDKVLVLIQLNGGNDGLNTVIPLDQYDVLYNMRENIILPENQVIKLTDATGIHPKLDALRGLYDDGKMTVVQSVGYPNQNRSHFRSIDIWNTGSPADEVWRTGWLGRMFDMDYGDYPEGYPNMDHPHPFAVTIGRTVSETCQGIGANFSLAFTNPFGLSAIDPGGEGPDLSTPYGVELAFLRNAVLQNNAYAQVIQDVAGQINNIQEYPNDNGLANQLSIVARLIAGGLETSVYVVNLGGFDTHAAQVELSDKSGGRHGSLMARLSEAVAAFQLDLKALGVEERVLSMTYSEFGRQVYSNHSLGTDHGTAAPLMLFGSCVEGGIVGNNPLIHPDLDENAGVPMEIDFRSVYGSILMDWFELPEQTAREMLFEQFQYLPLIGECNSGPVVGIQDPGPYSGTLEVEVSPSPFKDQVQIWFTIEQEWVRVSIFDTLGREVSVLSEGRRAKGRHVVTWNSKNSPSGTYLYRIQTRRIHHTDFITKM